MENEIIFLFKFHTHLELLSRLLPRHYTLANFLQFKENSLKFYFAYSLLNQNSPNDNQNNRFGVWYFYLYSASLTLFFKLFSSSQWLLGRKIGDSIWVSFN